MRSKVARELRKELELQTGQKVDLRARTHRKILRKKINLIEKEGDTKGTIVEIFMNINEGKYAFRRFKKDFLKMRRGELK